MCCISQTVGDFCQEQWQKTFKFINILLSTVLISSTEQHHSRNNTGFIPKTGSELKSFHSESFRKVPHPTTSLFPKWFSRKRWVLQHTPKVNKFELFWSAREETQQLTLPDCLFCAMSKFKLIYCFLPWRLKHSKAALLQMDISLQNPIKKPTTPLLCQTSEKPLMEGCKWSLWYSNFKTEEEFFTSCYLRHEVPKLAFQINHNFLIKSDKIPWSK